MKLKKPYILLYLFILLLLDILFILCSNPPTRLSRLEALFKLSDIQATSEKAWKTEKT
jgi:hypothetical protein